MPTYEELAELRDLAIANGQLLDLLFDILNSVVTAVEDPRTLFAAAPVLDVRKRHEKLMIAVAARREINTLSGDLNDE